MKKLLKWLAIVVGALIIILVIGIVALPFVFPLEKIKDFAVARISGTIHREVRVDKISFDVFSGIKLQGIYVGNRAGFAQKPFVSADAIELRYAFWPLFSRKIIIKEIRLVKPEILIEKNARGEFNFSDMMTGGTTRTPQPAARNPEKPSKPPFDLLVSSFTIKNGRITYADHAAGTTNEIKELNVSVSGFELALVKPIDLKMSANVTYQGKNIPISLAGKIGVNLAKETINVSSLALSVAGESINAAATVSNWKLAPQIDFSVSSNGIDVDPLLAIFAGAAPARAQAKPKPGALTKTINAATAAIPRNIGLNGNIDINNLTFQKFKVDKAVLGLSLARKVASANIKEVRIYEGVLSGNARVDLNAPGLSYTVNDLKLSNFNASPFTNAVVETFLTTLPDYKDMVDKVYGRLDVTASLNGRGVEPQDIMSNLVGDASVTIKDGELKRVKTLAEVGKMLKSNSLQGDMKFGVMDAECGIRNKIVNVKNLRLEEPEIKVHFKGGIDLNKLAWVSGNRLTLKAAPSVTKDLPKEFSLFRDDQGWVELTFEMTGGLTKPIPKPILGKPLEVGIGKIKAKVEAKKVELIQQASAEVEKGKQQLQEEAKKKINDFLKF